MLTQCTYCGHPEGKYRSHLCKDWTHIGTLVWRVRRPDAAHVLAAMTLFGAGRLPVDKPVDEPGTEEQPW